MPKVNLVMEKFARMGYAIRDKLHVFDK